MEYKSVSNEVVAIDVDEEENPSVYSPLHLVDRESSIEGTEHVDIIPRHVTEATAPTLSGGPARSLKHDAPTRHLPRQNSAPITQNEIKAALDQSPLKSNDDLFLFNPEETIDQQIEEEEKNDIVDNSQDSSWFKRLKRASSLGESTPTGLSDVVPTFYCNICLENVATTSGNILRQCPLKHQFCQICMISYFESQIIDGCVQLACPLVGSCGSHAEDIEVEALCKADIFSKYIRFKAMKGKCITYHFDWLHNLLFTL